MRRMTIHLMLLLLAVFVKTSYSQTAQPGFMLDPEWGTYPFKAGDAFLVSTLPDTNSIINGVYPIDDRGYAELPIVGKVQVSKMTVPQLVEFLRKNYESFLRFPNIYVKPLVRVSLLGGFRRPGLYYVDVNSSLWELVHLAGGTLTEDGVYDMRWQRNEKERSKDLTRFFEEGVSLKKMGFQSGDIFWTPSPTRKTFWDHVRDVMPILTFATTIWAIYNTYQRDLILLRTR